MKTIAEAEHQLKLELWHWLPRQVNNLYADFYLYYLPSSPEHDGGLLICQNPPANPDFKLAWPQRIRKDATVEQNFNLLRCECLRQLPILSCK